MSGPVLAGFRGLARNRGILEGLAFHHLLGGVGRQRDQVPVYHHRLESLDPSGGTVLVRQEGEFVDGCILVGNTVQVRGPRRGGTLHLRGGFNESLGARLALPIDPWKSATLVLIVLVCAEYMAMTLAFAAHGAW